MDMSYVTMIDLSGVYALEDIINGAKSRNIKVFVSNAELHIQKVLEDLKFIEHIGTRYYHKNKESVIAIILQYSNLEY